MNETVQYLLTYVLFIIWQRQTTQFPFLRLKINKVLLHCIALLHFNTAEIGRQAVKNPAICLLRAGWMRFGKTRSFFTEFAYPRSDLSV